MARGGTRVTATRSDAATWGKRVTVAASRMPLAPVSGACVPRRVARGLRPPRDPRAGGRGRVSPGCITFAVRPAVRQEREMGSNVRSATPRLQIGVFLVAVLFVLPWIAHQQLVAGLAAYLLAGVAGVWASAWFTGPDDRLDVGQRKHLIVVAWPLYLAIAALQSVRDVMAPQQPAGSAPAAKAPAVAAPKASPAPVVAPAPAPAAKAAPPPTAPAPAAAPPAAKAPPVVPAAPPAAPSVQAPAPKPAAPPPAAPAPAAQAPKPAPAPAAPAPAAQAPKPTAPFGSPPPRPPAAAAAVAAPAAKQAPVAPPVAPRPAAPAPSAGAPRAPGGNKQKPRTK